MQKIHEFCKIFAIAVKTQLNAAHAHFNKKLRHPRTQRLRSS